MTSATPVKLMLDNKGFWDTTTKATSVKTRHLKVTFQLAYTVKM